jgi:hypothetical protein
MVANDIRPETLDERLVYGAIVWTWGLYLLGALYAVYPVLGWILAARGIRRIMRPDVVREATGAPIPTGVMFWIAGMAAMTIPLVYGHMSFDLGVGPMIKSLIGWARGWFLIAVFVLAGATLGVRSSIIIRATNRLGLYTLILCPFFFMTPMLGLPELLYVSPLQSVFLGPKAFFDVELHSFDSTTGMERWRFFAPWSPAAAFVATMSFALALHDRSVLWRSIGITAAIAVCVMSQSRLALVAIPVILAITVISRLVLKPWAWIVLAFGATIMILSLGPLLHLIDDLTTAFTGARAASSRVRSVLQSIALHRWSTEAIVFGHGAVERGPHLVEFMPIGTHHTWNGLLFVKGAFGYAALAIPFAASLVEFALKSLRDQSARAALGVMMVTLLFSFGENIESLVYLLWPGFMMLGIAARQRLKLPAELVRLVSPNQVNRTGVIAPGPVHARSSKGNGSFASTARNATRA